MYYITHSHQTCYVKKSFIARSMRLISDIIERCQDINIPRIAVFSIIKNRALTALNVRFIQDIRNFWFEDVLVKWFKTFKEPIQSCGTNSDLATLFPWDKIHREALFPDSFCYWRLASGTRHWK